MPVPNSIKVQRCKNKDIKQKDANADQHSFLCIHLGNNLFKTEIIHYHSIPCLFFYHQPSSRVHPLSKLSYVYKTKIYAISSQVHTENSFIDEMTHINRSHLFF